MKIIYASLLILLFTCQPKPGKEKASPEVVSAGSDWFKEAKFGMFIHWGPYSALAGEWNGRQVPVGDNAEWIMQKLQIPVHEYRKAAAAFNPVKFNAEEWVSLAQEAGMKYLVITAKHHDGFAMYRSGVSDYNIADYTPFTRDPLKELSEACRKAGIKFGVYYSHREDWDHPNGYGNTWDYTTSQTNLDSMDHPELFRKYLDEKSLPQVRELLTNYGSLGLIWFDRGMYTQEQGKEFANLVHSIQPSCLVNGRVGHYYKELLGDYQSLSDNGMPVGGIEEYWESPQTLNETWGYSKFDNRWKPAEEIIRRLVVIVSKGGNYLLNIGPTGEGIIPAPSVDILKKVGEWMKENKESIYGTSPSPFPQELGWGQCTFSGNRIYLHVFDWPENHRLELAGLKNEVNKAYLLSDKEKSLPFSKSEDNRVMIQLPEIQPDQINSVIVLEIDGHPVVEPCIIEQNEHSTILLDYLNASTTGNAAKRYNRKGGFHISKMQDPDDGIEWHLNVVKPGKYEVIITYATSPEWESSEFILKTGDEIIKGNTKITKDWFDYQTQNIGPFTFPEPGEKTIQLHPAGRPKNPVLYFKSIEMKRLQ